MVWGDVGNYRNMGAFLHQFQLEAAKLQDHPILMGDAVNLVDERSADVAADENPAAPGREQLAN